MGHGDPSRVKRDRRFGFAQVSPNGRSVFVEGVQGYNPCSTGVFETRTKLRSLDLRWGGPLGNCTHGRASPRVEPRFRASASAETRCRDVGLDRDDFRRVEFRPPATLRCGIIAWKYLSGQSISKTRCTEGAFGMVRYESMLRNIPPFF